MPNPTANVVNIQLPTAATMQVHLYNALGQLLISQHFESSHHVHQLDIHTLPAGVYTLHILPDGQAASTQQLIKE